MKVTVRTLILIFVTLTLFKRAAYYKKSGYVQEIHVQKQEGFKVIYRNEEDFEKCMWIQEQTEKIDFCKWSFLMVDKVIQEILRVVCFVDRDSEL